MSRIGKKPILIPEGVTASLDGNEIVVEGPKGKLQREVPSEIKVEVREGQIHLAPRTKNRRTNALWGLTRSLLANAVLGVKEGFEKELEMVGVGFRAETDGGKLTLKVGFSHPVEIQAPEGIRFDIRDKTRIFVSGLDKQQVGQTAAQIRTIRPPEPYKGKGIRYKDEVIRRKPGKAAKAGVGFGEKP